MASPNRRLAPEAYVADGNNIFFVEGYTSDNPAHWQLMVAHRDLHGCVSMAVVTPIREFEGWLFSGSLGHVPTTHELTNLMMMVGNMQRQLKGIPRVRWTS